MDVENTLQAIWSNWWKVYSFISEDNAFLYSTSDKRLREFFLEPVLTIRHNEIFDLFKIDRIVYLLCYFWFTLGNNKTIFFIITIMWCQNEQIIFFSLSIIHFFFSLTSFLIGKRDSYAFFVQSNIKDVLCNIIDNK